MSVKAMFPTLPVEEAADISVALLTPAAVISLVMGLWRLSADLGWTGEFAITTGLFSHWQVWMALAIGLQIAASQWQKSRAEMKAKAGSASFDKVLNKVVTSSNAGIQKSIEVITLQGRNKRTAN